MSGVSPKEFLPLEKSITRTAQLPFNLFSCLEVTCIYRLCPDSLGSRYLISVLLDTALHNPYFKVLWTSTTWQLHLKYRSPRSLLVATRTFRTDGMTWVPYQELWVQGHMHHGVIPKQPSFLYCMSGFRATREQRAVEFIHLTWK